MSTNTTIGTLEEFAKVRRLTTDDKKPPLKLGIAAGRYPGVLGAGVQG